MSCALAGGQVVAVEMIGRHELAFDHDSQAGLWPARRDLVREQQLVALGGVGNVGDALHERADVGDGVAEREDDTPRRPRRADEGGDGRADVHGSET